MYLRTGKAVATDCKVLLEQLVSWLHLVTVQGDAWLCWVMDCRWFVKCARCLLRQFLKRKIKVDFLQRTHSHSVEIVSFSLHLDWLPILKIQVQVTLTRIAGRSSNLEVDLLPALTNPTDILFVISLKLILNMTCWDTPYPPEYTSLDWYGILDHLAWLHDNATPVIHVAHISLEVYSVDGVVWFQGSW